MSLPVICPHCRKGTLRWLEDPDEVENATMKCKNCGKEIKGWPEFDALWAENRKKMPDSTCPSCSHKGMEWVARDHLKCMGCGKVFTFEEHLQATWRRLCLT